MVAHCLCMHASAVARPRGIQRTDISKWLHCNGLNTIALDCNLNIIALTFAVATTISVAKTTANSESFLPVDRVAAAAPLAIQQIIVPNRFSHLPPCFRQRTVVTAANHPSALIMAMNLVGRWSLFVYSSYASTL